MKLVQVSTVIDDKLLRDDLPFDLQGIEHVAKARFCVVSLIPGSAFRSSVCFSSLPSAAASIQPR